MPDVKDASSQEIAYDFDIHAPDLADRVYDTYAEMRARCPVARSPRYGGQWVVTEYAARPTRSRTCSRRPTSHSR
jgi:hypothetical protein